MPHTCFPRSCSLRSSAIMQDRRPSWCSAGLSAYRVLLFVQVSSRPQGQPLGILDVKKGLVCSRRWPPHLLGATAPLQMMPESPAGAWEVAPRPNGAV